MKRMSIHASFLVSVLASLTSVRPLAAQAQPDPAQEKASLAAERRELAEIRLLIGADRNYAEAKERLAKLEADLAARPGPEARELASEVERHARDVARALGEAVTSRTGGQDELDVAVLAALERKEFGFIRELGRRAAPGLARAVRERPDELTNDAEQDPLRLLMWCDPLAADALLGEQLARGGFLWRKRVARAMESAHLLAQPELWSVDVPPRFLGAGIVRTLETYVEDPDVGMAALTQMIRLARDEAPTPILATMLERHLRGDDSARRAEAMRLIRDNSGRLDPGLLERLLDDADAELRQLASTVLLEKFPENRSLLAHVRDLDPLVRRDVAQWLIQSDPTGWGEEERSVLVALLSDTEAGVRQRAWNRLGSLPTERSAVTITRERSLHGKPFELGRNVYASPLPDEVYRSRLGSEDRSLLPGIASKLEASLCFELLEVLGRDPDARVLDAVVRFLNETPYWEDPAALLRVLAAVLDNPALTGQPAKRVFERLYSTRDGLEALLRWLIAREDTGALSSALDGFPWSSMTKIDPAVVAAFVARVFALDREAAERFVVERPIVVGEAITWSWTPELAAAFRDLAADEARPATMRVLALRGLAQRGHRDQSLRQSTEALLAAPDWKELVESGWTRGCLIGVLQALPGEVGNGLILRVLQEPSLEGAPDLVTHRFDGNAPGAGEIAHAVIEQRYGQVGWQDAVDAVIEAMGRVEELEDPETLARAARDPRHSSVALSAILELRDPRYLPLLAEIVARPADSEHLRQAIEALFGYLDEEAAEPLLAAAAKVTDAELRNACLVHLEKIREYQDARERWATRKVRSQTREQVIAELVGQLSAKSDDVKVQAIRALATWEAVEVMPRLIELTASGSKPVAAAARAALERLNAPQQD